jgi:hypothetical protein
MNYQKNYQAWDIKEKDFPLNGKIEGKILFILRYGILAPSTHNIQPWKFKIKDNTLKILPDFQRYSLPQSDATNRGLFMSVGTCITNIIVAAAHFGFSVKTTYLFNPSKSFFVLLTFVNKKTNSVFDTLFPFIVHRYSDKLIYDSRKISNKIINELSSLSLGSANVKLIDDIKIKEEIADIHGNALFSIMSRKAFRYELAKWLRPNDTKDFDGMPGFVMGAPLIASKLMPKLFPYAQFMVKKLAGKDKFLLHTSPVVGIIISDRDGPAAWVDGGRVYELLALTAATYHIVLAPMAAMIEDIPSNKKLRQTYGIKKGYLQLFFRLGYSKNRSYHTPRRDVASFLIR